MGGTYTVRTYAVRNPCRTLYAQLVGRPESPARRGPLTKEVILSAALSLVDDEGVASVSMRKLARRLGAGAMSLYNHVPNKEALLQGVASAVLAGVDTGGPEDEPVDVLLTTARSLRKTLLEHPNAVLLIVERSAYTPEGLQPLESSLGAFRQLGLGPRAAFYAQQATVGFVVGHVLLELEHPLVRTEARDESRFSDFEASPNLAELHPIVAGLDFDRSFEFGLEGLLEGVLEQDTEDGD
jgi:AcrR family transcriptional regulator